MSNPKNIISSRNQFGISGRIRTEHRGLGISVYVLMKKKECSECHDSYTYDNFYQKKGTPDGYSYYCHTCTSAQAKKYYRDNKDVRKKAIARAKASKREAKKFVLDYLSTHPCVDCGENRPACLDFDHLRDKSANVSFMVIHGHSISSIKTEIEKCQVLCANCHRVKTAADFGWYSSVVSSTGLEPA